MTATQTRTTYSIREFFAGKRVLVTGATGFLGKALLEKLLHDLPEVRSIHVLIRPRARADGSLVAPEERLREEVLSNSAFNRLRQRHGARFAAYCAEKIECIPGELTRERLGLDEQAYAQLAKRLDLVINSAATVVFDERLDVALETNTLSPRRLLELARTGGTAFVHVSTAYVSGMRRGLAPERLLDPREAIDLQLPAGAERPAQFDVSKEIERLATLCKIITADCETQAAKNGWAPDGEEARGALRRALVSAGMTRARSLGWNDTYTYTKFLAEQQLQQLHGAVPTVIVRPAIIESSLRDPEPGWLDGLRMADPMIVGFARGRLRDFPADPRMVLDIIPADLVVNAVLAAAAHAAASGAGFNVFHVASSSENPLVFGDLYEAVREYFTQHPMLDRAGRPVPVPEWKFPTVKRFRRSIRNRYIRPMKVVGALVDGAFTVPGTRRLRARLRTLNAAMEQLLYYVDIYSPYTNLHCRFETTRAREVLEGLAAEEREAFDFDVRKIRWRNYLQEVHIPGLKRNILRLEEAPTGEPRASAPVDSSSAGATPAAPAAAVRGVPRTIVDLAARGAALYGERPFVQIRRAGAAGPVSLSFEELFARAGRLAGKLRARLGLAPGERVALWSENGPEWALAYLAIVGAGGTAVPLDVQLPAPEAARLIALVEAKAVVVSPARLAAAGNEFGPALGLPPRLDILRDLEPCAGDAWPLPAAHAASSSLLAPAPQAVASILFTSGTTLDPKGVILTHGNFASNALGVAEVLAPLESDRFLSVLPLHHAFEFTGGLLTPLYGGSLVRYLETLRPKEVLATMREAGITVVLGVPRLFQAFAAGIQEQLDRAGAPRKMAVRVMSSVAGAAERMGSARARQRLFARVHRGFGGKLRVFVSGGAPLDPALFRFFQRFGIPIVEGYGLTETGPILTVNPLNAARAGSVGRPIPGVELKLREPDAQGVGEILARGPSITPGYWRDPETTERAFEGAYFRTGDLGRLDVDGYLHITGRVKEVIVTSAGKKVYPAEIEQRCRELPGLKDFCIVGLPARGGQGEEVTLVGVPEPGAVGPTLLSGLRAAVERLNQRLPSHQQIARVELQNEELPKTPTLKVQRGRLRARYAAGAAQASSLPGVAQASSLAGAAQASSLPGAGRMPALHAPGEADAVLAEVCKTVGEVANVAGGEVLPDQKLQLDLGLDSIGRLDLVGRLELRLNAALPEEALRQLRTVRDVAEAFAAASRGARGPARRGAPALAERVWRQGGEGGARKPLARSLSKRFLQGALHQTERVFFNAYLRITASGLEHLPRDGPFILASNHVSHLDTAAIRAVLGRRAAELHVMGAKDYFFDTRLKSWFFSTVFNVLPFDREEHTLEGLGLCRGVLERGKPLLIFPEGTRSVSGRLTPFKPGIGILALELDYPIVPTHVSGTFESLPKGRSFPRRAEVRVCFGAPVDFGPLRGRRGAVASPLPVQISSLKSQIEVGEGRVRDGAPRSGGGGGAKGRGDAAPAELYREAAELIRAAVERLSRAPAGAEIDN